MLTRYAFIWTCTGVPLLVAPVAASAQVRNVPEKRADVGVVRELRGATLDGVRRELEVLREALDARMIERAEAVARVQAEARARVNDAAAEIHAARLVQQEIRGRRVVDMPRRIRGEPGLTRRVQWYQDDPADSLFRVAHDLFTEQEYRRAAEQYAKLRSTYPDSRYFCDAAYYEAFSRYRLGAPDDLRTANAVLEQTAEPCSSGERSQDVPELRARIDGALARLGDAGAANRLRRAASAGQDICDREENSVKVAALSALAEMDRTTADPVLLRVLGTRDECSAPVRRRAVTIVARRDDADAATTLHNVARVDPDDDTREEAVEALGRMSNNAAYEALEELLRDSRNEQVQAEAAGAIARSDHPRAEAAVLRLIERTDVAENIRVSAIGGLARREPAPSLQSWQSMYARADSDELREAVIDAMAHARGDEAQAFLLGVARDRSASPDVREAAVSEIRSSAPIRELYRLYEMAGSRSMRRSIVSGLSRRDEPEATDRLIDIAKTSTDPEVREAAIRGLGRDSRKDDPKVIRALTEILECCEF